LDDKFREGEYANMMAFDPRGAAFGVRVLCMQSELGLSMSDF
jgi:hypothetical protein